MVYTRSMRALAALMLVFTMSHALVGCSGKSVDESDPAQLYKDALEEIESDHYQLAIDKLRAVKNKFPYSKYALDAHLKIGDVLFLQESFAEAAATYESFRDLHPKHEKVAYAMFRIAKSYYNDMPSTVARDMTSGSHALDAYNDFLRRFPSAPESAEAQKDMTEVRNKLADKELYVANFYWRENQFDSAKGRFEKIIALYPDTRAAQEAGEKIHKIAEGGKHNEGEQGARKR
jgi:outer membrane protein assembly factor BamD